MFCFGNLVPRIFSGRAEIILACEVVVLVGYSPVVNQWVVDHWLRLLFQGEEENKSYFGGGVCGVTEMVTMGTG